MISSYQYRKSHRGDKIVLSPQWEFPVPVRWYIYIESAPRIQGGIRQIVAGLTHWGPVTHIYVSKLTIIGSDNGLSPDRRQAIIWINAGLLLIGPLGTNFTEILIEILTFSSKKMHLKVSSAKRQPFCLGLNVLIQKRHYSIANALESYLFGNKTSIQL